MDAMMKGMGGCENMTVTFRSDYGYGGSYGSRGQRERQAANWVERLKIKTPSLDHRIDQLSGGNQQKAVLSKWLLGRSLRPLVLYLSNPRSRPRRARRSFQRDLPAGRGRPVDRLRGRARREGW